MQLHTYVTACAGLIGASCKQAGVSSIHRGHISDLFENVVWLSRLFVNFLRCKLGRKTLNPELSHSYVISYGSVILAIITFHAVPTSGFSSSILLVLCRE